LKTPTTTIVYNDKLNMTVMDMIKTSSW